MKKIALTLVIFFSFFILLVGTSINAKETKGNYDNKFIIKLKTNEKYNSSLKKKIEDNVNNKIKKATKIQIGNSVFYSIELEKKFKDYKSIKSVGTFKEIAAMQPVYRYHINGEGGDSKANNWHVTHTNAGTLKAYDVPNDNRVKVAVLDTGVYADHPALENVIDKELSYNFIANNKDYSDDLGHGTHVAGIIGAENDYSVGKNIDIVVLRVLQYGFGGSDDITRAINHAQKHNIPIINMSLGFSESDEESAKDDLLYTAIKNYDGLVVAATGNNGSYAVDFPAAYSLDNIISVASLDSSGYRSTFSNFHKTKADIFAPGTLVYSTCEMSLLNCKDTYDDEDRVSAMSGTSMATPVVSGILGNTLAIDPTLSTSELKDALIDSAIKSEKLEDEVLTDGHVDAMKVYNYAILKKKTSDESFATLIDGTIELWGDNTYGQLGDGTTDYRTEDDKYTLDIGEEITKYYITSKNIYLITKEGNLYVSGSNDYGQLGQKNSADSTSFVKFVKVDDTHKIKSLSFRDINGKYDENSLLVQLSSSKNYYKIGNNSFVAGKNTTAKTDKLQYVKHNKGFISAIYFYDKNSRTYKVSEVRKYVNFHEYYDENWEPIEDLYITKAEQKTITRKYDDYYTKEYLYIDSLGNCGDEHFLRDFVKYNNKKTILKSENNFYDVSCRYDYNQEKNVVKRKNISKGVFYYKNGIENYGYAYEYNGNGELKGNKYNFATKTYFKFNKYGFKTKIAHYKADGKLTKYKYSGKWETIKGITKIVEYEYEFNFNKKNYSYIKYKNDYRTKLINYKYKNNKKSSGYKYVYNSKGRLKGKVGDYAYKQTMKYDKNGKLKLKKIAHYGKNGKRSKYGVQYQKIQTKKGYDVKKYSYKYKMKKTKMIHTKYENNKRVKELRYDYNKNGKLKTTGSSQAVLTIREYANNKLIKISYYVYDTNGNKYLAYYRYY